MTGEALFNEVFFTDVRVPAENLIGEENLGLGHGEDDARQRAGVAVDRRRAAVGLRAERPRPRRSSSATAAVSTTRSRASSVVDAYIEGEILRYHRMRMISAAVNKKPGPDASLRKALADPHGKKVFTLAKDLMGADGMLAGTDVSAEWQAWMRGFLFSPALTVGGGTSEVLRNIIAERLLGLPHDLDVEQGLTWEESRRLAATR